MAASRRAARTATRKAEGGGGGGGERAGLRRAVCGRRRGYFFLALLHFSFFVPSFRWRLRRLLRTAKGVGYRPRSRSKVPIAIRTAWTACVRSRDDRARCVSRRVWRGGERAKRGRPSRTGGSASGGEREIFQGRAGHARTAMFASCCGASSSRAIGCGAYGATALPVGSPCGTPSPVRRVPKAQASHPSVTGRRPPGQEEAAPRRETAPPSGARHRAYCGRSSNADVATGVRGCVWDEQKSLDTFMRTRALGSPSLVSTGD